MVELETTVHRCHGVTFVAVTLTNRRGTTQRVTLRNTLSGPTWPPRRRGVSPAWDGRTWEGTLEPGATRGVGFTSPTPPTESPVELLEAERESEGEDVGVCKLLAERVRARPPRAGDRA